MRKTREERKFERSQRASRAATLGHERRLAAKRAAGIVEIYEDCHAYGDYEIQIKSIRSGKTNILYLHEDHEDSKEDISKKRRDNFYPTLNGKPWNGGRRISICGVSDAVRKSIVKTKSGSIV